MSTSNTAELKTNTLSPIGLDSKKTKELTKKLDVLLATYSIFYQNTRGYHWNIKGDKFFELHIKFEELYGHLYEKIDVIAERIVTIGGKANHSFSDYKSISKITESTEVSNAMHAAEDVLNSLRIIISAQKEVLAFANEIGDPGTYKLMIHNVLEQEKLAWMYTAYLEK